MHGKQWLTNGIHTIGDLYNEGVLMSYSDLVQKYDVGEQGHFWKYLQLREIFVNRLSTKSRKEPNSKVLHKHKSAIFYSIFSPRPSKGCKNRKLTLSVKLRIIPG